MTGRRRGLTRRHFLATASIAPGAALVVNAPRDQPSPPAVEGLRPGLPIDALGLDPATRADLEAFAQPVLREVRWLDELPLDGIRPAFRFTPDEDWP